MELRFFVHTGYFAYFVMFSLLSFESANLAVAFEKPQPIEPDQARHFVGKLVEVSFEVKAAKNSKQRRVVYLDSESNFQDEKNLGIAISEQGVEDLLRKRQVAQPEQFYLHQKIRVTGTVISKEQRVYIEVDAADQLDLAESKAEK